jgi:diaminohydroxyphosphoribosylaminopyrimidine deaminase/5-amino-6-(5-phosphoribosylamino)uracil reductase
MDEIVPGVPLTDEQAMQLALREARKGAGFVSPNPQVGCVILNSENQLVSFGYHKKFGGPHAEIEALQNLKPEGLRGARVFVTLEPCAHEGKTPSCAKALAQLPLKEVIYGLVDPNPLVSGQGAEILQSAGIKTTLYQGELTQDLEEVCEHFLVNFREKRPFFSLKVAASLDGQMALASGESQWITGEEARQHAHYLRAIHEATLVGQGTLKADNPSLNIRHPCFPQKSNKVIIVLGSEYSHLRAEKLNVLKTHDSDEVFFLERKGDGYRILNWNKSNQLAPTNGQSEYDLNFTRRQDGRPLASSILIEGGARVLSSFICEKRADRLYLFQAPILLGAKGGKPWTQDVIISSMK